MTRAPSRVRGLSTLLVEAVVGGSRAIERVQKGTADRTFHVLEAIPVVSVPARAVHVAHDAIVGVTHVAIRTVAVAVGAGAGLVIDGAEHLAARRGAGPEVPDGGGEGDDRGT